MTHSERDIKGAVVLENIRAGVSWIQARPPMLMIMRLVTSRFDFSLLKSLRHGCRYR